MNRFLSPKVLMLLGCLGACVSAQAISITVNPANVVCAVSVSGQAVSSPGIPATNVSLYVSQGGKDYPLVINQILPADGKFTWTGVAEGVTTLEGANVKAFTNRQTMATAAIRGSCTAAPQTPPPGQAAGNPCLNDQFKGRQGWQCAAVVGGWDNGQNFNVSSSICSRSDAEALAKEGNTENCNNLIFNIQGKMQVAAGGVVTPIITEADAAFNALKAKFASAADPNGANKPFWTTWARVYNNCKAVPAGTPPSIDRLRSYCGFDASGKQDPTAGIVGLITVIKSCNAATCTLDGTKIKYPSN